MHSINKMYMTSVNWAVFLISVSYIYFFLYSVLKYDWIYTAARVPDGVIQLVILLMIFLLFTLLYLII